MQITINVPDNLPLSIVQQYINNVEQQMMLMAKLTGNTEASSNNLKAKPMSFEQAVKIATECANLPVLDARSPDEILGYDNSPFGLFGDENGH
jgi:hypothetical protein